MNAGSRDRSFCSRWRTLNLTSHLSHLHFFFRSTALDYGYCGVVSCRAQNIYEALLTYLNSLDVADRRVQNSPF
jgi:hypothetical protein